MPSTERLLTTLRRAVEAFRATPGRQGSVVDIQDATEVFATGDLHGNLGNFQLLLKKADLARHPKRHLVLQEVIHGPSRYPCGGDRSHQLLDLVAALKCEFPSRFHFLPGNHELAQATERQIGKEDDELNVRFRAGVFEAYSPRDGEIYDLYCELIFAAPLLLRTVNRVILSHSLPNQNAMERFDLTALGCDPLADSEYLPGGSAYALSWGRDTRREIAAQFLAHTGDDLLITGHIPCERGFAVPNPRQVILDCQGTPACYCLFPADRPLTHEELVACVTAL